MLQQILQTMHVDPDILAELGVEQKEMLFLKIRQEQVRRYKKHENEDNEETCNKPIKKSTAKKVKILEDSTGSPWTWVHEEKEEKAEEIWKRLAEEKTKGATKAAIHEERKHIVKKTWHKDEKTNSELKPTTDAKEVKVPALSNPVNGGVTNKDLRDNKSHSNAAQPQEKLKAYPKEILSQHNKNILEKLKRGEGSKKISGFEREQSIANRDDSNLENGNGCNGKSEQDHHTVSPEEWSQQLRRFKEADKRRSLRASNASKQWKRQSLLATDTGKLRKKFKKLETDSNKQPHQAPHKTVITQVTKHHHSRSEKRGKPHSIAEIKQWFEETQSYIFLDQDSSGPPTWFHGIISRQDAENLLKHKNKGDFLIRVSNKIWGFTLSYKDKDEIKHFLLDASEEHCYHFFGNDQIRHESLSNLITFHKDETIMYAGEMLGNAIGQLDPTYPDYAELDKKSFDTHL